MLTNPLTAITIDGGQIPLEYNLSQNYPNPFNPETTIRYALPEATHVELVIYDVLGREIVTFIDGHESAGIYTVHFNSGNLPSGVYYYRFSAGGTVETRKMIVVR